MNQQELQSGYKRFFAKDPVGREFLKNLDLFIETHIDRAENNPNEARDHMQRSAGIREIANHIQMIISPKKKETPIS